ncbi:autotransporter-associated N-terminal domain-containing protein, partial [Leptotrichia sp. OH3620_COT-345]|uniref:autotransporter-associated N-terminal domain-containing protein n=1 Tax=Leptotrichia sp. OH3620_COT-345 TaxID=2491048 RepID=UPI000F646D56
MSNDLKKIEKELRALAKRYKDIKYTKSLLFTFLLTGMLSFSTGLTSLETENSKNILSQEEKDFNVSINNIKDLFRKTKKENNKLLKNANLELIQLMEQGDQVIKSPWNSWQFGMNYFYNNQRGMYKGFGDKKEKYPFKGIYTRASWMERSTLVTEDRSLNEILSQRHISGSGPYSTNKNLNYGFISLKDVFEPEVEIQVLANVNPKSINKEEIIINHQIDSPANVVKPDVQISVNTPVEAPGITFPLVKPVSINVQNPANPETPALASAPVVNINLNAPAIAMNIIPPQLEMEVTAPVSPNIGINITAPSVPSVNALTVSSPSTVIAPNIVFETVTPVDFILTPAGLSKTYSLRGNADYKSRITLPTINVTDAGTGSGFGRKGNYISTWGRVLGLDGVTTNVNVDVEDTRAFMIDEGIDDNDTSVKPFRYIGTINLNRSRNVGIDVQGTHTGRGSQNPSFDMTSTDENRRVANIKVINEGTVNGNGGVINGDIIKNQVAFGFNNFDASTNNTRNEMINNGNINLFAPESAGIQLRPENPNASGPNQNLGLNMMAGLNDVTGKIELKSHGSFGILTVANKASNGTLAASKTYSNYGTVTTLGGQIASFHTKQYESKIENKGNINVSGDSSIGIGLLHNIQGVYAGGTINIGKEDPTALSYANSTGGDAGKVEKAVGVYTEVETRPVKSNELDDFGQRNSTGQIIGTEGIELTGTVNIGRFATKSTGARIKDKGEITVSGTVNIEAGSQENYGVVVNGINYIRNFRTQTSAGGVVTNGTEQRTGQINITSTGNVNVLGNNSVGYMLVMGKGSNAGNITVNSSNSIGLYAQQGEFSNTGTISSTGIGSNAVVLDKKSTSLTFNNTGNLIANNEGTVALYVQNGAVFSHATGSGNKIKAGNGAVAIYNTGASSRGTVSAPIEVTGSTGNKTGIGVYSDGQSTLTFNAGSTLTLGNGTVGLFSAKTDRFNNTFVINNLAASLDDNAVLVYFKGDSPTSTDNEVTISGNNINNLVITKMGRNSALFYGAEGSTVTLGENIDLTNNSKFLNINETAQLLVTKDGKAVIDTGKTVTSNLKTTLSALGTPGGTRGNTENKGSLILSGKVGAIGIYLSEAIGRNIAGGVITANEDSSIGIFGKENSTIENSGTVNTKKQKSVGLLGETSLISNKQGGIIAVEGTGSAGIYGSKNSNITNEGNITGKETGSAGIYSDNSNATNKIGSSITIEKGSSAGIYAKVIDTKNIINEGNIKVGTTSNVTDTQSAGMYGELLASGTGPLILSNKLNINTDLKESVGILSKNGTGNVENVIAENTGTIVAEKEKTVGILSEKSTVKNTNGTISMKGKISVGIFGKSSSEIMNTGVISIENTAADSKSVGIISDTGTTLNSGTITISGGGSAGILGQNNALITNGSAGTITANGEKSAGIYTENSTSVNNGTITAVAGKSAGMFAKNSSGNNYTITNTGDINITTTTGTPDNSVGMYAEINVGTTGITTLKNSKNITVDQNNSVGMYVLNNSGDKTKGIVLNEIGAKIETLKQNSVGILVDKGIVTNFGTVNIANIGSAGIYGKNDSEITNSKNINISETSSAGIYAENSNALNDAGGIITVSKGSSAGIFSKVDGNAGKDYKLSNTGAINLTGGSVFDQSVGMYGELVTNATRKLTLENDGNINIGTKKSVGIYGKNNTSTLENLILNNTGTVTGTEIESVGILGDKGNVINNGTINMNGNSSAGIFAKIGSEVTNNSLITMSGRSSAGIYAENSNVTNAATGTVTITKGSSAAVFGQFTDNGNYILNNNGNISLTSAVTTETQSVGIYGEVSGTGRITINNNKNIDADMLNSVGIYAKNNTTDKTRLTAINNDTITMKKANSVGIFSDKSVGENRKNINILEKESTGIFGKNGAKISNASSGVIILSDVPGGIGSKSAGMYVDGATSKAVNEGNILLNGKSTTGMSATDGASVLNSKTIIGNADSAIGIYGNKSTTENDANGIITLNGNNSTGIFAKNSTTAKNTGVINLESVGGSKKSVGMYGITDNAADTINLSNTGTINLNSGESVGIFAQNGNSTNVNSTISNTGNINLNKAQTVGIFTPKSKITSVGNIILSNDADSSVAVYLTDLAEADASTGNINLNTISQNQVAYYIKDTGKIIGTNVGNITGYGVGVYLDGGTLNSTSPILDYTLNGNNGNGIIGLLLKGNTNITGYTKKVKVGDTTGSNYAIAMYSDGQGSPGNTKNIDTALETGENGVGLFAENGSNISYKGQIAIGNGTKAGTAIYIGNGNGTTPSTVTIDTGANITLKGENGVGAIVTKGATVNFNAGATIELQGAGVGLFGQKGAVINDNGGTFNNNGHSAERIRITGGISRTTANTTLTTGNVLTHVINGEAVVENGVTVDAAPNSKNIIGLLAEGNRDDNDPTVNWLYKDTANPDNNYDTINLGNINFTNATSATGMYLESARGKNTGIIKVGDSSTAIYGVYKDGTPKFDGVTPNKSVILNDTGASVEIGNSSAGIYSVGFEKVQNKGNLSGKNNSVGIYAVNFKIDNGVKTVRDISMNIKNLGNITLGNGTAGIYVKQDTASVNRSNIEHSGSITVGDAILDASGNVKNSAVGIYAEKTNITSTGNITVGKKGIALFGNNSIININRGNIDYSKGGSLAYLENSVLNYNTIGTLQTYTEPLLFINNSIATMAQNDINISPNELGAYMSGTSQFNNWNKIALGINSTGIYADNADIVLGGNLIESSSAKSKGIVSLNSNLKNSTEIKLSGDESLGIYSKNTGGLIRTLENSGNIEISGKKTVGAYLEGTSDQIFTNKGNITVGDSSDPDRNNTTIGIYAKDGAAIDIINEGQINTGKKSVGIYSISNGNIITTNTSSLNVFDEGIGIYKKGGSINLAGTVKVADHTSTVKDSEPVGIYGTGGVNIINNASSVTVGNKSYGVILGNSGANINKYANSVNTVITLGNDSTYLYSDGKSEIENNGTITSPHNRIIAIYAKNKGQVNNKGNIDLSQGIGNLGIYATGTGSKAVNSGKIKVGKTDSSDKDNIIYGIGMAADKGAVLENKGDIYVSGNLSIGMYAKGAGTEIRNSGNVYLDASSATVSDKIATMTGVFVDDKAKFINTGTIKSGSYSGNDNVNGLIGVAVLNGSTLENYGTIDIDADRSYGVLIVGTESNKSVIKNYGTITIKGKKSYGVKYKNTVGVNGQSLPEKEDNNNILNMLNGPGGVINASNGGKEFNSGASINKSIGDTEIVELPNGKIVIKRNGTIIEDANMEIINHVVTPNIGLSNFGIYVDTLGRTKPISIEGITTPNIDSDLIIGTEFSENTNSKNVIIGEKILKPFLDQTNIGIFNFTPYSGSLTWMATPQVNLRTGKIEKIIMAKIPYTAFVPKNDNSFNFADGLEQRYDMNEIGSREKALFDKLNSIGNNEQILLSQAYDEMMGHQYANVQQRINRTGTLLDKEFTHLKKEWDNKSKQSNKIKAFGMRD